MDFTTTTPAADRRPRAERSRTPALAALLAKSKGGGREVRA